MREQLLALLDRADSTLATCVGIIDDPELDPLRGAVARARTRLAYPEEVAVVAFAGGTGSGKSSLFNALTGQELAHTGGVRPTTTVPIAAVPISFAGAMDDYLDQMGIEERYGYAGANLCLLDLPDTDSIDGGDGLDFRVLHSLVDLVVWVTDPEKYRDARLHHDHLRPAAHRAANQTVFVLNQVDRLSPDRAGAVLSDFARALEEDGFAGPEIVPTAAAPSGSPPIGLEELASVLADRVTSQSVHGLLFDDLSAGTRHPEANGGDVATDFDTRAATVTKRAAGALASGELGRASDVVTGFLDEYAAGIGGHTAERIEAVAADVPAHLRRIMDSIEVPEATRRRRFPWSARQTVDPDPDEMRDRIVEAVVQPTRAILAQRAVAIGSIAELAVEVQRLADRS